MHSEYDDLDGGADTGIDGEEECADEQAEERGEQGREWFARLVHEAAARYRKRLVWLRPFCMASGTSRGGVSNTPKPYEGLSCEQCLRAGGGSSAGGGGHDQAVIVSPPCDDASVTGRARVVVWLLVVLLGLAALGMGIVAAIADLDTSAQLATVAGSFGGLAAAALSGYTLLRPPAAPGSAPAVTAAGARSVAVGGSIGRAVTGDRSRLTTGPVMPGTGGTSGSARTSGERGIAAAGEVGEAITGDDAHA
ncbi:hypothetical protein ABZ606_31105 [Streptomyces sp. NPDC012461]|uniref:hypothetical protein n=1 Tax=Streptomyces sp. NPDC012461 TaxID=3155117 RepID=UPI0033DAA0D7